MRKSIFLFLCLFLISAWGEAQIVHYVRAGATGSGVSWQDASGDLQEMVNVSSPGDQVWVASGTYTGESTFTMKEGVNVYGGFAGTETSLDQRDWQVNVTILDGNYERMVLKQPGATGFETETVWDGFTITHANSGDTEEGGGVHLLKNGTVSNCIITGNTAVNFGGGVHCKTGSLIKNCIITNNSALNGGGVFCANGGTVIDCEISGNVGGYGGGIVSYGGGEIVNCVITGNTGDNGGGLYHAGGGTVVNCLIAGNHATVLGGGVWTAFGEYGLFPGLISNTIIWNNTTDGTGPQVSFETANNFAIVNYNYCAIQDLADITWGYIANSQVINLDGGNNDPEGPHFTDPSAGNYTLTASSPCINLGDNSYVLAWDKDLTGNTRILQGKVDLGPYESSYGTVPASSARYFVSLSGDDLNDGTSWATAKKTLQGAIDAASGIILPGETKEIWVSEGTYTLGCAIELKQGVQVYGGFTGTESSLEERNWVLHPVVLDANPGSDSRRVLLHPMDFLFPTRFDGFTLINGSVPGKGGGALVRGGAILSNCVVSNSFAGWNGGGVYLYKGAKVDQCTIKDNNSDTGGGLYFRAGGTVTRSFVRDNEAWMGGGVTLNEGGTISSCLIKDNSASYLAGGISTFLGGNVFSCTVTGNTAGESAGGIYGEHQDGWGGDPVLVANTIFWNNSATSDPEVVTNENQNIFFYHNAVRDLDQVSWGNVIQEDNIDLETDNAAAGGPAFTDPGNGDYTLTEISPCLNTGDNSYVTEDDDLAGNPRIQGWAVDMGAYESPFGVSIREIRSSGISVNLFPNPATDHLNVSVTGVEGYCHISVLDLQGRMVKDQMVFFVKDEKATLSVAGIDPGMYILQVEQQGAAVNTQFVIR